VGEPSLPFFNRVISVDRYVNGAEYSKFGVVTLLQRTKPAFTFRSSCQGRRRRGSTSRIVHRLVEAPHAGRRYRRVQMIDKRYRDTAAKVGLLDPKPVTAKSMATTRQKLNLSRSGAAKPASCAAAW
jgi:hypothetical protein